MTIVTNNKVNKDHLKMVKSEMNTLGAPSVRAIYDGEIYFALEGSHRLMAAHELGLTPIIDEIEYSDETIRLQIDGFDEEVVISEYADRLFANNDNHIINFLN